MSDAFRVVVADPPWKFNDDLPGKTRGAGRQYTCLRLGELTGYAIPPLADDCLLFLWRVAAMQREALEVVAAWGFEIKSELVWRKLSSRGKAHFGMGRYVRMSHEVCLIATRGKPKVRSRSVISVFSAQVGSHSSKPERFYDIVEELAAGPYLELFARRQRRGWTCLGNQSGLFGETRPLTLDLGDG